VPTILVVDDNAAIAGIIERHLTGAGYAVVTAPDGPRALEVVSSERPDCVLLDIMMPDVSGLEVLRRLKADPATAAVPVILVTGKSEDADAELGYREGAAAYVTKPFKAAQIVDAVRKVLAATPDPTSPV